MNNKRCNRAIETIMKNVDVGFKCNIDADHPSCNVCSYAIKTYRKELVDAIGENAVIKAEKDIKKNQKEFNK